ncbi:MULTISPECIES: hypothetical protein [Parabacteroides]|uniref:hypothetical protein n=1 Tax=Parabacteroides TaxID=375288 RepID=UPI0011DDF5F6|nr:MULTISPECIES: hypothetical protein [Parabacteroides]
MLLLGTVNSRHAFQKEIGSSGTQRGTAFVGRLFPLWLGAPAASSAVTCLQHQNRSPYTDIGFFPCFGLF